MESLHRDSEFQDENVINPSHIFSTMSQTPSTKWITFGLSFSPVHCTSIHSASLVVYTILFIRMLVSITSANYKHSGLTETGQSVLEDRRRGGRTNHTCLHFHLWPWCNSKELGERQHQNTSTIVEFFIFHTNYTVTGAKKQSNVASCCPKL
jgi:hypothetical protein